MTQSDMSPWEQEKRKLPAWKVDLENKERRRAEEKERISRNMLEAKCQENLNEIATLVSNESELLEKFFNIANGRLTVDEYGDSDFAQAKQETTRFIAKFLSRNPHVEGMISMNETLLNTEKAKREYVLNALREQVWAWFLEWKKSKPVRKTTHVDAFDGIQFENHIVSLFKENGIHDVVTTRRTGDQGVDLIAQWNNRKIAIQAKRYTGNVGNAAVQEVAAGMKFYGADDGWVICATTFTTSARTLAKTIGITLVDRNDIDDFGDFLKRYQSMTGT